jgi:hypothetical protein
MQPLSVQTPSTWEFLRIAAAALGYSTAIIVALVASTRLLFG